MHAHSEYYHGTIEPYEFPRKLESAIDAGGDVESNLNLSKDILKKWTKLTSRDIESAFGTIKLGSTYNLLATLPRTLIVKQKEVIVNLPKNKLIDNANVCRLMFDNKYPIDLTKIS